MALTKTDTFSQTLLLFINNTYLQRCMSWIVIAQWNYLLSLHVIQSSHHQDQSSVFCSPINSKPPPIAAHSTEVQCPFRLKHDFDCTSVLCRIYHPQLPTSVEHRLMFTALTSQFFFIFHGVISSRNSKVWCFSLTFHVPEVLANRTAAN